MVVSLQFPYTAFGPLSNKEQDTQLEVDVIPETRATLFFVIVQYRNTFTWS